MSKAPLKQTSLPRQEPLQNQCKQTVDTPKMVNTPTIPCIDVGVHTLLNHRHTFDSTVDIHCSLATQISHFHLVDKA